MKKSLSLIIAALMLAAAAALAVPASASSPFDDVKETRWSYSSVVYAVNAGYMKGTGERKFSPAGTLTRAMVAAVLWRRQGSPAPTAPSGFSDVPDGQWYTDAVAWAKETGVVNGVNDKEFRPKNPVTREQLATMLFRYSSAAPVSVPERADLGAFPDGESVHGWASEAMGWAVEAALVKGKDSGALDPAGFATREQFAAIIERFDNTFKLEYRSPVLRSHYTEPEYPPVDDADFYVSTDGDDSSDGSFDHPFRTWERARDAVRALDKTDKTGITVAFFAGEYGPLSLSLTAGDSGTADCPVTYCKYGDGDVVFRNGAVVREDDFVPLTDSEAALFPEAARARIRRADLNAVLTDLPDDPVIVGGGKFLWEARFPNKYPDGSDRVYTDLTTTVDDRASIRLIGSLASVVRRFSTVEGMKITGYLRTGWFQDTFPVKSYDAEAGIIYFDFENFDFSETYSLDDYPLAYEGRMEDTVFFHNLAEMLDEEGEYWIDPATRYLYVYAPTGEYSIPTGGTFLTSDADFVTLRGLSFIGAADGGMTVGGDGFTLDRCRIGDVSGKFAVRCGKIRDLTVTGCELFSFAHGGIAVKSSGDLFTLEPCGHVIENNLFRDFGNPVYFEGEDAVFLEGCVGARVAHNEFVRGAHGAVRFQYSVDTAIEYNVFDGMMAQTQDFGAVYSYMHNTFRDNAIRHNLFMNIRAEGAQHGIYLDGADGQIAESNLFYNSGSFAVTFNGGRDNDVHDNVIVISDDKGRKPFMYRGQRYDEAVAEEPTEAQLRGIESLLSYLSEKPDEGEPGYDVWRTRWAILYDADYDRSSAGRPDSVFTPLNYVRNNKIIGSDLNISAYFDRFAVKDGTETLPLDANPYFVNPSVGDYRTRADAGIPDIEFEKMGRY